MHAILGRNFSLLFSASSCHHFDKFQNFLFPIVLMHSMMTFDGLNCICVFQKPKTNSNLSVHWPSEPWIPGSEVPIWRKIETLTLYFLSGHRYKFDIVIHQAIAIVVEYLVRFQTILKSHYSSWESIRPIHNFQWYF